MEITDKEIAILRQATEMAVKAIHSKLGNCVLRTFSGTGSLDYCRIPIFPEAHSRSSSNHALIELSVTQFGQYLKDMGIDTFYRGEPLKGVIRYGDSPLETTAHDVHTALDWGISVHGYLKWQPTKFIWLIQLETLASGLRIEGGSPER